MTDHYHNLLFTPAVRAAQAHAYGRSQLTSETNASDRLTEDEIAFIAQRDSFYIATINEEGWPYIQHRGGQPGFLQALDEKTLAFADLRGNRQLLTTGNLAVHDRVSLFFMDYPRRERLKIIGHARSVDLKDDPKLAARLLANPATAKIAERFMIIDVVAFDWNCPKYITPRYTVAEVEAATKPLRDRIAELEATLAARNRSE